MLYICNNGLSYYTISFHDLFSHKNKPSQLFPLKIPLILIVSDSLIIANQQTLKDPFNISRICLIPNILTQDKRSHHFNITLNEEKWSSSNWHCVTHCVRKSDVSGRIILRIDVQKYYKLDSSIVELNWTVRSLALD